ncbi:hypothetical protein BG841_11480 [Marinobacter sp. X15-166B]|nr:hypothetical protein BG841_11480 [Marinobacter sp. X15-166B]
MLCSSGLRFTARIGGVPADVFVVVGFELTETLSSPFRLTLDLASYNPDLVLTDLLEQPTELTVWQDRTPRRRFAGVVAEASRGDSGHRRSRYQVIVKPPWWRLELVHACRMFQAQATDTILRGLLAERGVTRTRFDLRRPPAVREYCVQYRESDLAFVHRLAAEEGWHYRIDATDGRPALVIADHHGNAPHLAPAPYNAHTGGSIRQPAVFQFHHHRRVRATSVVLQDYTFKKPRLYPVACANRRRSSPTG